MVSTEIGSDFSFGFGASVIITDTYQSALFGKDNVPTGYHAVLTDSGRSALRLALKQLPVEAGNSVLVPSYLCNSVAAALLREKITPIYYAVDTNLEASLDDILMRKTNNTKMILIMDYFGCHSGLDEYVPVLVSEGLSVIYDVSHSLFYRLKQPSDLVTAYVGSLRKLLPLPDGGIVFSKAIPKQNCAYDLRSNLEHASVRTAAMIWKEAWLRDCHEPKPPFRELFIQAESLLDKADEIGLLCDVSRVMLNLLDFDSIIQRRRRNFLELAELSTDWPKGVRPLFASLRPEECPLGFPIIVEKRDDLKHFLIENRVYPPVHWPIDESTFKEFPESIWLSRHILTLPCDHRYDERHMQIINNLILKWGNIRGKSKTRRTES